MKEAPRIKWLVEPTYDDDGVQRTAGIDQFGREHGDPVPVRPPVGLSVMQGDETHALLKRMFQQEREAFMRAVEGEQFETEEEANDFLVAEDMFPPGNEPWEDVHEFPAELPPQGSGRSPEAASQPPANGENRAAEHATRQPSQIVSSSTDGRSGSQTEQRPIDEASDLRSGRSTSVGQSSPRQIDRDQRGS